MMLKICAAAEAPSLEAGLRLARVTEQVFPKGRSSARGAVCGRV